MMSAFEKFVGREPSLVNGNVRSRPLTEGTEGGGDAASNVLRVLASFPNLFQDIRLPRMAAHGSLKTLLEGDKAIPFDTLVGVIDELRFAQR
jgi:hypothetical protein